VQAEQLHDPALVVIHRFEGFCGLDLARPGGKFCELICGDVGVLGGFLQIQQNPNADRR